MVSPFQKLGASVLAVCMVLTLANTSVPAATSQTAITGQIDSYPAVITAGVDFAIAATTNANRVRFELQKNGTREWYQNEYPDAAGNVSFTDRLSSLTKAMEVTLVMMDYSSRVVLDQKAVSVVAKSSSSSSSSRSSSSSSKSSSSKSSSSQISLTGNITTFPPTIKAGTDFTVKGTTNAPRIRFELYRGTNRVWYSTSQVPDASGNVSVTKRLSSLADPGVASLHLIDYSSKKILNQKCVVITPRGSSSSSGAACPSSSSSSQASSAQSSASSIAQSSASSSASSLDLATLPKPIEFLLPDFPESGRVMEGDWVRADVKNGIGNSAFYIDVLYDGQTVYSHPFAETNTDGVASVLFQMPYRTLKSGHLEDGLTIQLTHADITFIRPFTLVKGLNISVPSEIKEDTDFHYEVQNSAGETLVEAGINYDAGDSPRFSNHQTDGSGYLRQQERMPRLIRSSATRDGAEFWVKTKDVTWYFPFTIVKGDPITAPATVKKVTNAGGGQIFPAPVAPPPRSVAKIAKSDHTNSLPTAPTLFDRSKNVLVIIMYGSNQEFDQKSGMDTVYYDLHGELKNVYRFETGINHLGVIDNLTFQDPKILASYNDHMAWNKNSIRSILNAKPEITGVVLVGFSWGGSAVYDLSNWLRSERGLTILGTGYVDAIAFPDPSALTDVQLDAQSALNLYQHNRDQSFLHGAPITSTLLQRTTQFSSIHGKYFEQDINEFSFEANHDTIHKNKFVLTIVKHYVKTVIKQITP